MEERNEPTGSPEVGRRRLLRGAGAVLAGAVGAGVASTVAASPASAATGSAVIQGGDTTTNNSTTTATTLTSAAKAGTFVVSNTDATTDAAGNHVASPALVIAPTTQNFPADTTPAGGLMVSPDGTLWFAAPTSGTPDTGNYLLDTRNANATIPVTPQRMLDTRSATSRTHILNPTGNLDSSGRLLGGHSINLDLSSIVHYGDAAFLNVTVVGPLSGGYLTVYAYGTTKPATSNINFAANQVLSNGTVSGLGAASSTQTDVITVFANVTTHVIVDVLALATTSERVNPTVLPATGVTAAGVQGGSTLSRADLAARSKPSWS